MQARADSQTRHFRFRGLRVVYERVPGPITAIALTVRAGARFDGPLPGLAHMSEHMLFQGTSELDQLALNRRAADVGSGHNASTGYESIALTIEAFNNPHVRPIVAAALETGRAEMASALASRSDVDNAAAEPLAALLAALFDGVILHRVVDADLDVTGWADASAWLAPTRPRSGRKAR